MKKTCINTNITDISTEAGAQRCSIKKCSARKGVLRNFAKFTRKHLPQRLWRRCFPVNSAKFLRTPFLAEHLRWLLLFLVFKFTTFDDYLPHFVLNVETG